MPYSIRVQSAQKITVEHTGEEILSVLFNIMQGDQVVLTSRHGFSLDTSVEDLECALQKELARFTSDQANAERSADSDARDAQADATIAGIVGKEITI